MVGISGVVLVRLPKRPNRGLLVAGDGLGVVPLDDGGITLGLRSGIMPRPAGAGVALREGDGGMTGLGDGFLEGSRVLCCGRKVVWS